MIQQTQINGNRPSFVDIDIAFDGIDFPQVFLKVDYDAELDPGNIQANQIEIVGRTAGYGIVTASFEILADEANDLNAAVSQGGRLPILGTDFFMSISYGANDIDTVTDKLYGARIKKITTSNAQGNNALTKVYDLSVARIQFNGLNAFSGAIAL